MQKTYKFVASETRPSLGYRCENSFLCRDVNKWFDIEGKKTFYLCLSTEPVEDTWKGFAASWEGGFAQMLICSDDGKHCETFWLSCDEKDWTSFVGHVWVWVEIPT